MKMTEMNKPTPSKLDRTKITATEIDEALTRRTNLGRFGWPILIQVLFYVLRISGESVACRQVLDLLSNALNHKYVLTARSDTMKLTINSTIFIERRDRRLLYIPIRDQKYSYAGMVETTDEGREGPNRSIPKMETLTSFATTVNNEEQSSKEEIRTYKDYNGVKHFFANPVTQLVFEILGENGQRRTRRVELLERLKYLIPRDKNPNRSLTRALNRLIKMCIARKETEGRKAYYSRVDLRSKP